jgi:hypothetical protein
MFVSFPMNFFMSAYDVSIVITFLLIPLFPFKLFMSMMYLFKYLTAATNADVSFKERPLIRVAQTKNKAAQPVPLWRLSNCRGPCEGTCL